jgi:phage internal scaffolding protein
VSKSQSNPEIIKKLGFAHNPSPYVQPLLFGDSLTEQSHKDACDLNIIVARAQHNPAVLLDKSLRPDVFRDFSESLPFVEMFNKVCEAKSAFEDLPSDVRSKFRNDPANLIDFVSNPNNALEAHDLGLLELDEASLDALTKDNDTSTLPVKEKSLSEPAKAPEPEAKAQLPT